ncbi:MAG: pyridoxal phosphate-dependent aminotransferase [Clostridia bacterium]|nr:pyridoxal phosphate-dependent aminotransferase [Clostridia bacterium]
MISEKMTELGLKSSVIRELFEYGNKRKAEIGEENVFDFSLGNPSVPAPQKVNQIMLKLLTEKDPVTLHGYTSAAGAMSVRKAMADSINKSFKVNATPDLIYMTCGAAASLTITLNALLNTGDEVIVLAPYFPEYKVFIEKAGGIVRVVKCRDGDFQIDFNALEKAINKNTKAIIVNSPNNPSGVVLSEETIITLSKLLNKKSQELNTDIYIISDEPYRELVYCDIKVPYIPEYYDNAVVCYSFSKSLSLPGERIGYIFVSPKVKEAKILFAAVCGAGRALGYVCAPSLLQYTVAELVGETADIQVYKHNRDLLVKALTNYGYTVAKPDGAFYLFVKSPERDATSFSERAKKYELLLVPSDSFGYEGYVRLSYCVSTKMIEKSLPQFKKLMDEYR